MTEPTHKAAQTAKWATTDDGVIRGRSLFLQNKQGETVIVAGAGADGNGLLPVELDPKTSTARMIFRKEWSPLRGLE